MSSSERPSDSDLLRIAQTDPEAFRLLYDRHAKAVFGFLASRAHSDDLALDLTAETFAEAFRVSHRFRAGGADARPWLFGIASNLLHVAWRSQRIETRARERLGVLEATRQALDDRSDEILERIDLERSVPELGRALASLPRSQRTAVELRVAQESSYAEIAEVLGCTTGSARVLVFRGLRHLNSALGASDAFSR